MAMLAPLSRAQATAGERARTPAALVARRVCVRLHRYAGLAMALFLAVAGLTGSIIAFNDELDVWLNPELFQSRLDGELLPPSELARRVEAQDDRISVAWIPLKVEPGDAAILWISTQHNPATGAHYEVGFNQLFVEPSTGELLGKRDWGAFSVARQDLLPFIYVLHYSLHLRESVGVWLMGIVAIVWILDCFIGAYLTLPQRRPYLAKWKPAWLIKFGASGHRVVFDLHRAVGLWFWGLLLALAVSAVYLNLAEEVFKPVVGSVLKLTPPVEEGRERRVGDVPPKISFEAAIARAAVEAKRRGWTDDATHIGWDHEHGIYSVQYHTTQFSSRTGLGPSTF
jgi:uncharacterized iron-regulated membrane protein